MPTTSTHISTMKKVDHSSVIIGNLEALGKTYLVGFPEETTGSQKYEGGQTLAEVATYNEYGRKGVKPRPFMTRAVQTFEEKPNVIRDAIEQGVVRDGNKAGQLLALMLANEIKEQISRGSFAPNSERTVAQKGSSRPLVDTGKMLGAVDWVEKK